MNKCQRCGVPYHPDLTRCPLCRTLSRTESGRRTKLFYLANTIAVSLVAGVILVRALTTSEIAVGMTPSDCQVAQQVAKETRFGVESLASDPERGLSELAEVAASWEELAANYTPGKYSWSTSGLEHGWLERLALSTRALSTGDNVAIEGDAESAEEYVLDLTRLVPRFCER